VSICASFWRSQILGVLSACVDHERLNRVADRMCAVSQQSVGGSVAFAACSGGGVERDPLAGRIAVQRQRQVSVHVAVSGERHNVRHPVGVVGGDDDPIERMDLLAGSESTDLSPVSGSGSSV
jgi:hypothetical protein